MREWCLSAEGAVHRSLPSHASGRAPSWAAWWCSCVQLLGRNPCCQGEAGGTLEFNLSPCYRAHRAEQPKGPVRVNLCSPNLPPVVPVPPGTPIPRTAASGRGLVPVRAESLHSDPDLFLSCPQCPLGAAEVALPSVCPGTTGLGLLCGVCPCWPLCARQSFPMSLSCSIFSLNQISQQFSSPVVPISPLCRFVLQTPLLSHLCSGVCA